MSSTPPAATSPSLPTCRAQKFTTVSCKQCGYTELYRGETSMLGNIFDFFVGD